MNTYLRVLFSFLLVTTSTSVLRAQIVTYTAENEDGTVGDEITLSIGLSNDTGVNGFTIAVCQDPNFASVVSVANGPLLVALPPTPFITTRVFEGDPADPVGDPGGFTVAVVVNLISPNSTIPPSADALTVVTANYQLMTPGLMPIVFCNDTLQFGASAPVSNTFTSPGSGPLPLDVIGVDGSIDIGTLPPLQLEIGSATGAPGDTVDIPVLLANTIEFEGFSFGVQHDDALATLVSITEGSELAATNAGAGSDLFFTDVMVPGMIGGGVVVSSTSLMAPFDTAPIAPAGFTLLTLRYEIAPSAMDGTVIPLDFVADLGAVPVPIVFSVDGESATPTLAGGAITVSGMSVPDSDFVRGDANGDGVVDVNDVWSSAMQLSGSMPIACEDALDANDDGVNDVNDGSAIATLIYAFGPALPGPSVCGADPTPDALGCDTYTSCP